ncbi:unnamed protein product [Arctia plantaginis]|uniref:Uncharacterized protein n=1 Tax=Arctia plantaginis TaxID=874455 RepID=A0A8S1AR48_ARCPL|nr:unnamed protein product [Arctia plantaginis]
MARVANGGARTPTGTLRHFLAAPGPAERALARSDYLRPPLSPARGAPEAPRSSLSLRVDDEPRSRPRLAPHAHSYSVHALRRQGRARSPPSPPSPPSPLSPPSPPECDCLPVDPIPPPELFDF